jgi:hypothetical protein
MASGDIQQMVHAAFEVEGQELPDLQLAEDIALVLLASRNGDLWSGSPEYQLGVLLDRVMPDIIAVCDEVLDMYQGSDEPEWQQRLLAVTKIKEGVEGALPWTQPAFRKRGAPTRRKADRDHILVGLIKGTRRPQAWMYRVVARITLPFDHPRRQQPFDQEDIRLAADTIEGSYKRRSRGT